MISVLFGLDLELAKIPVRDCVTNTDVLNSDSMSFSCSKKKKKTCFWRTGTHVTENDVSILHVGPTSEIFLILDMPLWVTAAAGVNSPVMAARAGMLIMAYPNCAYLPSRSSMAVPIC